VEEGLATFLVVESQIRDVEAAGKGGDAEMLDAHTGFQEGGQLALEKPAERRLERDHRTHDREESQRNQRAAPWPQTYATPRIRHHDREPSRLLTQ
jgi:hypothetical protein